MVSARIGRGLRKLTAIRGYSGAVTILWRTGHGHSTIVEQEANKDSVVDGLRIAQDHPEWQSLLVLQLLLSYEETWRCPEKAHPKLAEGVLPKPATD